MADKRDMSAGNIGNIPRADMPQIATAKQAAFLGWLTGAGVAVAKTSVDASELAATQAEIDAEKVAKMADAPESVKAKPVIVSLDGYVLDGHHHWAHHAEMGEKVNVAVVGLEMVKLLEVAQDWASAA